MELALPCKKSSSHRRQTMEAAPLTERCRIKMLPVKKRVRTFRCTKCTRSPSNVHLETEPLQFFLLSPQVWRNVRSTASHVLEIPQCDYSNSLHMWLPLKFLWHLQLVQNTEGSLFIGNHQHECVSGTLMWYPPRVLRKLVGRNSVFAHQGSWQAIRDLIGCAEFL